ncbi:MAG: GatB/YqeY domain-containing protein [Bacteroides sp.]
MTIFEQVNEDLKGAMKAKDKVKLQVLRNVKKSFLEAKTAPGANNELTDEAALKIIQKLSKQGKDSAKIYQEGNRDDLAQEELIQVEVLEGYLPKQLSPEELELRVKSIIEKVGANSMKDMGKVMGIASKELAGIADGKDIATKVKELLA